MHHNHLCLVFELLSLNLYEVIRRNKFRGFGLPLVRVLILQVCAGVADRVWLYLGSLDACRMGQARGNWVHRLAVPCTGALIPGVFHEQMHSSISLHPLPLVLHSKYPQIPISSQLPPPPHRSWMLWRCCTTPRSSTAT